MARTQGPQRITRFGKDAVMVIAAEEYERLLRRSPQPGSLLEFFRRSPLVGLKLKFERTQDRSRDIEL